ncbi:MAG: DUF1326 domain-containing protein [Acidobacteriota bacterium]|nr:MAG: DUF1326 domain-containing protein [Acidobacteriota bacterium]
MRKSIYSFVLLMCAATLQASDPAAVRPTRVEGDYVEARTADVWTGPCFANGEVNLTGKEALLAWSVRTGDWKGVQIDGLKVVAVLRASATLGDPFADPLPAKAGIIVDNRASKEQSEALVELVQEMGGELLADVVWVKSAPVEFEVKRAKGFAYLKAGELAELKTRSLHHHDMHCGNETVYYEPLTQVVEASPAFTLANRFDGEGLGTKWSWPLKRNAFIGTFSH